MLYHLVLYEVESVKEEKVCNNISEARVLFYSASFVFVQEAGAVIYALKSSMVAANRTFYPYLLVTAIARETFASVVVRRRVIRPIFYLLFCGC
jgi:hypothetical protein